MSVQGSPSRSVRPLRPNHSSGRDPGGRRAPRPATAEPAPAPVPGPTRRPGALARRRPAAGDEWMSTAARRLPSRPPGPHRLDGPPASRCRAKRGQTPDPERQPAAPRRRSVAAIARADALQTSLSGASADRPAPWPRSATRIEAPSSRRSAGYPAPRPRPTRVAKYVLCRHGRRHRPEHPRRRPPCLDAIQHALALLRRARRRRCGFFEELDTRQGRPVASTTTCSN